MKTIEQASREHAHIGQYGVWKENSETSFKAGVKFAQTWINVEDELPEVNRPYGEDLKVSNYVIAKIVNGNWYKLRLVKGMYGGKEFTNWVNSENYTYFTVTHWRPIELK